MMLVEALGQRDEIQLRPVDRIDQSSVVVVLFFSFLDQPLTFGV